MRTVVDNGTEYQVYLQVNTGPLRRLELRHRRSGHETSQEAVLSSVFTEGAASCASSTSPASSTTAWSTGWPPAATPTVVLSNTPPISFRGADGNILSVGLRGLESGATINVVNLIRVHARHARQVDDYKPPARSAPLPSTTSARSSSARSSARTATLSSARPPSSSPSTRSISRSVSRPGTSTAPRVS